MKAIQSSTTTAWPWAVAVAFAGMAIAAAVVVGSFPEFLSGPFLYLGIATVTVLLLAGLARPIDVASGASRVRLLGSAALVAGFVALYANSLTVWAYKNGPGRTEWIQGTTVWVTLALMLLAMAILIAGVVHAARHGDEVEKVSKSRAIVIAGTVLGAAAFLAQFVAIAYDLGGTAG